MKKNVILCAVLAISAVVFFGCASAPAPVVVVAPAPVKTIEADYRIVDSKAMSAGMTAAPEWYVASQNSNAEVKELYPDSAIIVQTADGTNLEAIKFDLETFGASRELAGRLSTYLTTKAGQTTDSDGRANIQKAMSSFTAVASTAEFSGLEKEADYWLLKEFKDGSRIYTYVTLYIMPQVLYNQQIDAILNEMPDDEKAVIQPLVDKAKEDIGDAY